MFGSVAQTWGAETSVSADPLFNFKTSQFTQWAAGVAAVKANSRRGRVLVIGESGARGEHSGDAPTPQWLNTHKNAPAGRIAADLTARGLATNIEDLLAMGGNAGVVPIAQLRGNIKTGFNAASPWAETASTTLGGCMIVNSTDATALTYSPEVNVDTFELWDVQAPAAGVIEYSVDGGAWTQLTQTNAAASARRTQIAAGSLGAHTLSVRRVSGTAFFAGVRAWDSAVHAMDIINGGRGGATAALVANKAAGFASGSVLAGYASTCDLIIIGPLQVNDEVAGTAVNTTFKTNMQTLITDSKAGGASVLLVTGHPVAPGSVSYAVQETYRVALKELATLNDVPLFDCYALFGSYEAMQAQSWIANVYHKNKAGYQAEATAIAAALAQYGAV